MLTAIVAYVAVKWDHGPVLLAWFASMPLDASIITKAFGVCTP